MRALVQRVSKASVTAEATLTASIGRGVLILLGIGHTDTPAECAYLAAKVAQLRIFEDEAGKMNLSLQEIGGQAIVVSQFTLYADTSRGRRPSFVDAALPGHARPLVDTFAQHLRDAGIPTGQGIFGADMQVEIHNDGPVTIWLERETTNPSPNP